MSSNSPTPGIDEQSIAKFLVQTPDVIIYRNGGVVFDQHGANGQISLQADTEGSVSLTHLSIASTNDTQPNTLQLEFSLGTSAIASYQSAGKNTPVFGISDPVASWAQMDHIEVFIAPNIENGV